MVAKILRRLVYSKKSSFWSFLIPYVIILSIPIIIVTIIYAFSYDIIKTETRNSTIAMLEQAKQIIDVRLKEINNLTVQITCNPRIQHFMYVDSPLSDVEKYKSLEIIKDLNYYKISNEFISDFFIYFRNSDVIINNQSRYTPKFFYENIYTWKNESHREWYENYLLKYNNKKYYPSSPLLSDNKLQNAVTYIQSIPMYEKNSWFLNIVVIINEDNIRNVLKSIVDGKEGMSYIINEDGQIIIGTPSQSSFSAMDCSKLEGKDGCIFKKIDGKNMAISYVTSSITNWKYVSIVPIDIYMSKVNRLRDTTISFSIILLIVGLMGALLMAYREYIPFKSFINAISYLGHFNTSVPADMNDYFSIKQFVEQTVEENNRFKAQVPILRENFFNKLIKGEIKDGETITREAKFLNINFRYSSFYLVIMLVENIENALPIGKVCDIISNYIVTNHGKDSDIFVFTIDDQRIAVICNFDESIHENNMFIIDIAERIRKELEKNFNIIVTSAISDRCCGVGNIATCYKQAMSAMSYRPVKGKNAIISYDEVMCFSNRENYYYPLDLEEHLVNIVISGDISKVNAILEEIYKKNFIEKKLSPFAVRCLMFNMIDSTVKCLYGINSDGYSSFRNNFNWIEQLSCCETVEELYSKIRYILSELCMEINQNKKSHNISLKDEIIKYINNNYADPNICLNTVASKFNLSPAYLSRFFKEQTGVNFMDFLNKIRLEKAMHLMDSNKGLLISEIASMVGCTNTNALIRLFKKYKGITPSQ